ncbi:hypothetical protein MRX96_047275 [Rhipicephalus microplus]
MATPSLHYACIIVPDSFPTVENCVICVCVWDSLSYVAAWASKSVGSEYLRLALASAFCGNPDSLWKWFIREPYERLFGSPLRLDGFTECALSHEIQLHSDV